MIIAYFKIAWRNLSANRGYSTINIAGLAIGMMVTLIISLWIHDELTFDKYHKNYSRIGQVMSTQTFDNETGTDPSIVVPMGEAFRTRYAKLFREVALTSSNSSYVLSVGNKKISGTGLWAEADLPEILSLEMRGDPSGLKDPSSMMLSQSIAYALFGNENAIGQIVRINNQADLKIVAVYADLPAATTLNEMKMLLSWNNPANKLNKQHDQWQNHGSQLFVRLQDGISFAKATAQVKDLLKPFVTDWKEELLVHPMSKWHLYNQFENGKSVGGKIQFVWLFGIIAVFVLLLACINFMNLSTARSARKAKEIGIRKAIGSVRRQLIFQFLIESLVFAFISMVIAIVLTVILIPLFNQVAAKEIIFPFTSPVFWMAVTGVTLFTGLLAGSYPAFYLSGFSAIKILKGSFRVGPQAAIPRKVLVVMQFSISIALIIGTIVVFRQIMFTKNRAVGYSREGLIVVDMNTPDLHKNYNSLRNDLLQTRVVDDMAETNSSTTEIWSSNTGMEWKGKKAGTDQLFGTIAVTHDYGNTIGWQITAGRDFSREFPADSGNFILNESAIRLIGIKDPIGQTIRWNNKERVITGIVKDMIMESPYEPTVPTIFHMQYGWVNKIIVRIKPGVALRTAMPKITEVFEKHNPSSPFEFSFVDDNYAKKFSAEERIGNLAAVFAGLAILISCMGLFGLSLFITYQRRKEISVRKVVGASTTNLWRLITLDFAWLILVSLFIAIPVSYFALNEWLQQYQYRTNLSWWIFAAAGAGAMLITILTVSYHAIRVALINPAKILRSE